MDDMTGIDVPAVRAMGAAVDGVADRLARTAAEMRGWEDVGRGAVDGSATTEGGLIGAVWAWEITIDGLAAIVRDYGHQLRAAAGDFSAADTGAADRIQSAGTPGA
ncbi:hypothetical protein KOI35_23135 [Actinoplanes bogorensis]|uniref:WXG100 family type VII secretion target n=1 Tax=Paractinoplanes bogorensis TaxID=1610840 RepID=A0ABS5YSI7_9ACTN|nr:hypothetical protein [Actinoplanes bogorensis]MBU2666403.1 hypothetical protein [Actinoplanes bogorensis]